MLWSVLLVCFFFAGAVSSYGQSLGELARRERGRKQQRVSPPSRIYTNEDLARRKILEPEERARFQAANPQSGASPEERSDEISPGSVWWADVPLGDVARYYRKADEQKSLLADKPAKDPVPISPRSNRQGLPVVPARNQLPGSITPVMREETPLRDWVEVQRGDSLWKLAERYLGGGNQWRKIAAANPELSNSNLIHVGQRIRLPEPPSSVLANKVRVQKGDSLWKLAHAQLGDGHAWSCIAAVNPQIQDTDRIFPGQVLAIPAGCKTIT